MPTCANDILGRNGAIARRLGDRYEFRPQQLEMATAVEEALNTGEHLMVEAGTGVGKSFAYLLPAIDFAVKQKKRVVISTHTISLQEQLIEKDIPLLQAVYPDEFTAVLIKGRSNYLCKRRLEQTRGKQGMLFEQQKQLESLWAVEQWAGRTTDGSLADLPSLPDPSVWDKVCAEHGNCLGKKCRFYEDCFWQAAKRRMYSGTLLVTNHALFFSDLALRAAGVNYLPKYDAVILDEAHTVEDVAGSHFGLNVSEYGVRYQLRALFDMRRGKGMLSTHGAKANDAIQDVVDLHELSDEFFEGCLQWQDQSGRANGRIQSANFVENTLSPKLRALSLHLRAMLVGMEDEEEMSEISSHADKAANLAQSLDAIVGHGIPEAVYWLDKSGTAQQRKISLHAAPVNIAAGLKMHLFDKVRSVVMTSATLCTGKGKENRNVGASASDSRGTGQSGTGVPPVIPSDSKASARKSEVSPEENHGRDARATSSGFDYFRSRLGVPDCRTLQLGSPFDYSTQATLYLETDLPEPNDTRLFLPAACGKILHYLKQTEGGAFVLFTSYKMLIDAANRLKDELDRLGYPILVQGQGAPRKVLLERFRNTENAVLFGTGSFWQGIDVQGDQLRNVIIVKLPFAVPDEPIIEARLDTIKQNGGNPFMDYSVPEAIIKLKQGFGRLIRSKTDTGIVVILDSRVKSKRYGKLFLDALPECRRG